MIGIRFMKNHHNHFIVTQSNGDLYIIDPISAEIIVKYEWILKEQSIIDLDCKDQIMISINETGNAWVFSLESFLNEKSNSSDQPKFKFSLTNEFQSFSISPFSEETIIGVKFIIDSKFVLASTSHG